MHDKTETYRALKVKLCKMITSVKYCCICLEHNLTLSSIKDVIRVSNCEGNHDITLKNLLSYIFAENDCHSISSEYICTACMEKCISTYTFIYDSKRTFEILSSYLTQLDVEIKELTKVKEKLSNTAFVLEHPPCAVSEKPPQEKEIKKKPIFICDYCKEVYVDLKLLTHHIHEDHAKVFMETPAISNLGRTECKRKLCSHQKHIQHYGKDTIKEKKTVERQDYDKTYSSTKHNYHTQTGLLKCEICSKKFCDASSLANHNKIIHNLVKSCNFCCKLFSDIRKFDIHVEECKGKIRPHKCNLCPASFDTEMILKKHIINRHQNLYACDTCFLTFPNDFYLMQHKKMHCVKYSKLTCLYCGEKFDSTLERKLHVNKHDPNDKPYCKNCNKHFTTEADYNNHLDLIRQKYKYSCEHCTYKAATANTLEAHVNGYHLKIKPYKCTECPKTFANIGFQKQHIKTHETKKQLQCHICTKMFGTSLGLKKHIRLHTGERPYPCDLCEERFNSPTHRINHKVKKHSKEKTIKCPFCPLKFFTPGDMRHHFKKTHWKVKGEKFDIRKVKGLKPEELELFRDRRLLML